MPNTKQPVPADAVTDHFQPDWNSKHGNGVEVPEEHSVSESLEEIYGRQRDGEKARLETEEG